LINENSTASEAFSPDVNFDWLLLDLYKPSLGQQAGGSLKVLHLIGVRIGLDWEKIYKTEPSSSDNVNNFLDELLLDDVVIVGRHAVKLLRQFVGLCKLQVNRDTNEDSPDHDEEAGNDETFSYVWKKVVERIQKLVMISSDQPNDACFVGLLEATCSHETLESVEHTSSLHFRQVLEESRRALLGRVRRKQRLSNTCS
jgi:hypothetical protein